jgi:O-antigen/teichoic acid export membrane protein
MKGGFFRNALIMIVGTSSAQLISIATLPFLARLYSPSDFGILATFISTASIVGVFSTLRTERKIISENDDRNAKSFFFASTRVSLVVSIVSTLIICVFMQLEFIVLKLEFLPLIFIFSFFYGVLQSSTLFASRISKFVLVVKASFIRALLVALFQVGLFFILPADWAIVLGPLIGLVFASFFLCIRVVSGVKRINWMPATKLAIRSVGYKKNAMYGGIQALSSTLSNNMPMILISTLGGYEQVGIYMMAERMVKIPINLISNNLRNVIASRIKADRSSAHSFISRASLIFMLVGMVIFIAVYFLSDFLYIFFLGKSWLLSSEITKIMFVWVVFNWASLPFQAFNMNFGLMKDVAFLELVFGVLKIISLVIIYRLGYGLLEVAFVIAFFSSGYSLSHIVTYFFKKNHKIKIQ